MGRLLDRPRPHGPTCLGRDRPEPWPHILARFPNCSLFKEETPRGDQPRLACPSGVKPNGQGGKCNRGFGGVKGQGWAFGRFSLQILVLDGFALNENGVRPLVRVAWGLECRAWATGIGRQSREVSRPTFDAMFWSRRCCRHSLWVQACHCPPAGGMGGGAAGISIAGLGGSGRRLSSSGRL